MEKNKMCLHEFIKTYIAKNTFVRLWRPVDTEKPCGDKEMLTNDVVMELELLNIPQLENTPVIHITDTLHDSEIEAVNIVISTSYGREEIISMIDEYRDFEKKKRTGMCEDS